jgi:hypothetical protein
MISTHVGRLNAGHRTGSRRSAPRLTGQPHPPRKGFATGPGGAAQLAVLPFGTLVGATARRVDPLGTRL